MSSEQTDPSDLADPLPPPENSTSARNLMTVALRILGFWLICKSIIALSQISAYAMYAMQSSNNLGDSIYMLLMTVVQVGGPAAVGISVILLAGRISRRIYPSSDPTADLIAFGRVGAGDLYHIASFMMGVYMLIQAVEPGVRFLAGTMKTGLTSMEPWAEDRVINMIPAAVYSLSGLVLIFGSRGIAQAMVAVPRNSDEVPVPQFGIRSLLILGVVFAVVLGVLRMVMDGIR
jgi:hypothetical protein